MKKTPFIERAVAFIARLFAIAVGVVVGAVIAIELNDKAVSIEEMSVPEELNRAGYSPSLVAHEILYEWTVIDTTATTLKRRQKMRLRSSQVELSLPGGNISIGSFVDYFKSRFGLNQESLRGGIVIAQPTVDCPTACYTFRLEPDGPGHLPPRYFWVGPKSDVDGLIRDAARMAVEKLDPYLLANFYYAASKRDDTPGRQQLQQEVYRLANVVLTTPPNDDDPWAHTLLGAMANRDHRWADALPHLDRALALDPRFASALNSRCFAEAHLPARAAAAITDCRAALQLNPESFETMDSLASALEQIGRSNQAFQLIKCARSLMQRARPEQQSIDVEQTYQRLRAALPDASTATPSKTECNALMQPDHRPA